MTTLAQTVKLKARDAGQVGFGREVALDNGNAVIGSSNSNPNGANTIYVYSNAAGWNETAKLRSSGSPEEKLGINGIAIENDTILIGAAFAEASSGTGYVFKLGNGSWAEIAKFSSQDGSSSLLGYDMAISNGVMLVGGHEEVHVYSVDQL